MHSKDSRDPQDSKYGVQRSNSASISLETEEEENEEEMGEGEDDEIENYDRQSMLEEQINNIHMMGQGPIDPIDTDDTRQRMYLEQHIPDEQEYQNYEASGQSRFGGEEDASDEDPIPDDEDKDHNLVPSGREPDYMTEYQAKGRNMNPKSLKIKKNNKRSTSHNKRLKNNLKQKGVFKDRKASDRMFLNNQLTPDSLAYANRYSRNNPHNLSHALTQQSPSSFKNQGIFDDIHSTKGLRHKQSQGRIMPSQSHGMGMKMSTGMVRPYQQKLHRKPYGMYSPLAVFKDKMDPRFTTFDNEYEYYEEESQEDIIAVDFGSKC